MNPESCGVLNFSWIESNRNMTFMEYIKNSGEMFSDVTLVSNDLQEFQVHKLVLSACSKFFENIFQTRHRDNLVLFLSNVTSKDLTNILEFVYMGSLNVPVGEVEQFVSTGNILNIKGIVNTVDREDTWTDEKPKKRRGRKKKILSNNEGNTEDIPNQRDSNDKCKIRKETKEEINSNKDASSVEISPQCDDSIKAVKDQPQPSEIVGQDILEMKEGALEVILREDELESEPTGPEENYENKVMSVDEKVLPTASDIVEEIEQNYSQQEILTAYKTMMTLKGLKKDKEVPDIEDTNPSIKSGREKRCYKCDYTTMDSSNFKRHVVAKHKL